MSLFPEENILTKEIESWKGFSDSLKSEEDKKLFIQILDVREIYSGSVSLQLNDTMRILTVFSSILLPLAFLTSIFGMEGFDLNNIQSIPQGFTVLLIAMAVVSMALSICFGKDNGFLFRVICIRTNNNSITNELWLHIESQGPHSPL